MSSFIEMVTNNLERKILTPYQHGYQSGSNGQTYFDCPYSNLDHMYEYRQWMKGHSDGVRDRIKRNPPGELMV